MAEKLNGNAKLTLFNRSSNIIRISGFKDVEGNALVLGTEADRGIVGAPQPEAKITVATLREMRKNKALDYMFTGDGKGRGKTLEAKQPFAI